ncbi:MAG: PspC domain-containing protein [Candidatus Altiarchaeales archaeon HGW-Altiarchaeales-1]|nr:MAG: PspC domain-containing protein [Candidatus Altiarchaeales archaeon HGW-Altiarchaeales-1]
MPETEIKRIYRSKKDKAIAGVCGGMAEYLNTDPTIIRIFWAASLFASGFGIVAYVLCRIIIPANPNQ